MQEPEPQEVLFASYTYEDYSGSAVVVYRNGEDYFVATGGHCSCYGLEGQWSPEKYDVGLLGAAIERGWNVVPDSVKQEIARRAEAAIPLHH